MPLTKHKGMLYNICMIRGVDKVFEDLDSARKRLVRLRELDYISTEFADEMIPLILALRERVHEYMETHGGSDERIRQQLLNEAEDEAEVESRAS